MRLQLFGAIFTTWCVHCKPQSVSGALSAVPPTVNGALNSSVYLVPPQEQLTADCSSAEIAVHVELWVVQATTIIYLMNRLFV